MSSNVKYIPTCVLFDSGGRCYNVDNSATPYDTLEEAKDFLRAIAYHEWSTDRVYYVENNSEYLSQFDEEWGYTFQAIEEDAEYGQFIQCGENLIGIMKIQIP